MYNYILLLLSFASFILTQPTSQTVAGDPRTHEIRLTCENPPLIPTYTVTPQLPHFRAALDQLFDQLLGAGFGMAHVGEWPYASYALAQCHGDLSSVDCATCFSAARLIIPTCYGNVSSRVYLDGCFLRGDTYRFFEEYGERSDAVCGNSNNSGKQASSGFAQSVRSAVGRTVAAAPRNTARFARATENGRASEEGAVHVMANCWRTLNESSCRACLESASSSVLGCLPLSEGRALNTGCFMRYSDTDFLNEDPPISSSGIPTIIAIVAIVSSVVALAVGGAIGVYVRKHRLIQKRRRGSNDLEKLAKVLATSGLNFKFSVLERATGWFKEENKLGRGGFGIVYKGVLVDGREIAVKRLFFNNSQRAIEFYNEVNIITTMEHKNLVRLLGCSCSGPESLLIYEFLPNRSLDLFIFDPNRGKLLDWGKRLKVIIGIVEGLTYLHENIDVKIIHRDIKASNILLDSKFQAKIADFGLARPFQDDNSHISTKIAGTLGYMAPEYVIHGRLTEKADVYSFGVLLLEIVTGKQNNSSENMEFSIGLIIHAWKQFQQGTLGELIDPNLLLHENWNDSAKNQVLRVAQLSLVCTQESPLLRPAMSKVLAMLTIEDEDVPHPTNPPFIG